MRSHCLQLTPLEDRVNLSPPTVTGIVFNPNFGFGGQQRSIIKNLAINFSEHVTFTGNVVDAFSVSRTKASGEQPGVTGLVNLSASVNDTGSGTVVTLTFNSTGTNPVFSIFGSLPDGRYNLGIDATKVAGTGGQLDGNGDGIGGDNYLLVSSGTTGIFRLFGDSNGDGAVAANDFIQFRLAVSSNPQFDYTGDGAVAADDYVQFRMRFGGDLG